MAQLNKVSDIYTLLFHNSQKNLNTSDVALHLIKLTNNSYASVMSNNEKAAQQAKMKAEAAKVESKDGAGVINERKKAMQAKLKAAIGNSRK